MPQDVTGREYQELTPAQEAELAESKKPHQERFRDALQELRDRVAQGQSPTQNLVDAFQRLFDEATS